MDKYGNRYYQNLRYFVGKIERKFQSTNETELIVFSFVRSQSLGRICRSCWIGLRCESSAARMVSLRIESLKIRFNSNSIRHRWLQYISDEPPTLKPLKRHPWMIDHIENQTGTKQIYVPYSTVPQKIHSWKPPSMMDTKENSASTNSPV